MQKISLNADLCHVANYFPGVNSLETHSAESKGMDFSKRAQMTAVFNRVLNCKGIDLILFSVACSFPELS